MGCSSCKTIKTKTNTTSFTDKRIKYEEQFNNNYLNIPENVDVLNLEGKLLDNSKFVLFCQKNLPNLENLNLKSNNLSDISGLKNLNAPKLKILDLSDNNIKDLEPFKEFKFPLEELYLKNNPINQISIFMEENIFKNLNKLRLNNIDYESNKDIISNIKKSIKDCIIDCETNMQKNDKIIDEQLLNKKSTLSLS